MRMKHDFSSFRIRFLPAAVIAFTVALAVYILTNLYWVPVSRHFLKPIPILIAILVTLVSYWNAKADKWFVTLVLAGLVFAVAGDSIILFPGEIPFLIAMILFLATHISYVISFMLMTRLSLADAVPGVIVLVPSVFLIIPLVPNLAGKTMFVPVLVYTLALSLMVWRAIATFRSERLSRTQAMLIVAGAVFFYVSDIILAYDKFVSPVSLYHLINPLFYFPGQLLIALSTMFFPDGKS